MKAIMLMFDSLNRHFLPCYGGHEWVKTPNFDRLAQRTAVFTHSFVGSMPCMPTRRELHTGRPNFLHRGWGPLEPFDDSTPELLKRAGVYTHLVSDHYHYWEDGGCTYHNRYNTWQFIRGQEGDAWMPQVAEPELPDAIAAEQRVGGSMWRQDAINRRFMQREEDTPLARTIETGLDFLRRNGSEDNWWLTIECFDPHEPFFAPQKYRELYKHDYTGKHFDWPPYRAVQDESPEAIEHIRFEYAALVSMCDEYLGKVLDMMDEQGLWDDTMLIVNCDHGHMLGERGCWAKCWQPWYNELARTPLFVWDPRSRVGGQSRDALVQAIDLPATLLDYFDQPLPADMIGRPLTDTLAGGAPGREGGLFGVFGQQVNVTDGRYVYMRAPASRDNQPLAEYTHMPTRMRGPFGVEEFHRVELAPPFDWTKGCPLMKIPCRVGVNDWTEKTQLFDIQTDPDQQNPLDDPAAERMMIDLLVRLMVQSDAPAEQYQRLGLKV